MTIKEFWILNFEDKITNGVMVTLCCHHVITTNSHQGSVELSDWLLRNRNERDKNISSLQSWSEFKLGGHIQLQQHHQQQQQQQWWCIFTE